MSNQQDLVQEFANLTGANEAQSRFFLEANGWNLELAASQYFENGGAEVPDMNTFDSPQQQQQQQQEQLAQPIVVGSGPTATPAQRKPEPASTPKIRTIRDLMWSNDKEDTSDEEHENLYAGGEKSGMIVQGPNKRANLVDEILKKAAEGGHSPEETPKKTQKKSAYSGVGYRLGSEDEPSTVVQPAQQQHQEEEEEELESVTRVLTFWRNGFSVDDGPLYAYADPANQEMLTSINEGRAPLSLLNVRHGQPVEVRVVKRQDEEYVAPKVPVKAFTGTGMRLGNAASYSPSPSVSPSPPPAATTSNNPITVDDSQPTTNVQIRLADGSRLIARLNHTHTVADIRRFIESSHPTTRDYILQTTFPVKALTDNQQTVKEAGLLNSVIIQRYQ